MEPSFTATFTCGYCRATTVTGGYCRDKDPYDDMIAVTYVTSTPAGWVNAHCDHEYACPAPVCAAKAAKCNADDCCWSDEDE